MIEPPALAVHRRLLEQWRVAMDLVGPGPIEPHFQDALAAMGWIQASGRWVDLGSGAGFPGIALAALWPEAEVLLVERRQKRAAFLETVIGEARLSNAKVSWGDAEKLPDHSFAGVVARAFLPPGELFPFAARLLQPGGTLVLLLAREEAPSLPGWELFHVERYSVETRPRRAEGWRWIG